MCAELMDAARSYLAIRSWKIHQQQKDFAQTMSRLEHLFNDNSFKSLTKSKPFRPEADDDIKLSYLSRKFPENYFRAEIAKKQSSY